MQAYEVFFDSVIKLLKSEPIPLEYNTRADSRFQKIRSHGIDHTFCIIYKIKEQGVPTRRIRLSFMECAYQDLRDLLHNFRGLQWIPL